VPVFEEREDTREIVHFLPVVESGPAVDIEGDPVLSEGREIIGKAGPLFQQDRDVAVPGRAPYERMIRLPVIHLQGPGMHDTVDSSCNHAGLVPPRPGRIAARRGQQEFSGAGVIAAAVGDPDPIVPELPLFFR